MKEKWEIFAFIILALICFAMAGAIFWTDYSKLLIHRKYADTALEIVEMMIERNNAL